MRTYYGRIYDMSSRMSLIEGSQSFISSVCSLASALTLAAEHLWQPKWHEKMLWYVRSVRKGRLLQSSRRASADAHEGQRRHKQAIATHGLALRYGQERKLGHSQVEDRLLSGHVALH